MNSFDLVSNVPDRMKEAMKRAGMKQVDLVNATGIDKGSISHYLSGKYEPKSTSINKLAKALNVSEMWLWGYDCPMDRPAVQKEIDALADLIDRLRSEKDLRALVLKISALKPGQMDIIKNLVDEFSQSDS